MAIQTFWREIQRKLKRIGGDLFTKGECSRFARVEMTESC